MSFRMLDVHEQRVTLPSESGSTELPLALRDVERRLGSRQVLKGATLSLGRGELAWLGGPNGAGKTTLLRVAAGLITPDAGSVSMCGLDPERDRRAYQGRLGYVSAGDRGLYARLTVVQNLEFWAGLAFVPRRRRDLLIELTIGRFALQDIASSRVDRLSMGQRQRVRLSIAFLHEPEVVLLDEPHTSLDDDALELLDSAFTELNTRGGAVLWCSPTAHHLPLRAEVKYLLDDGRVRAA